MRARTYAQKGWSGAMRGLAAGLVCAGVIAAACAETPRSAYAPRTGDIVFQSSLSSQSRAIQEATGSRYSHVGVVLVRDGVPVVFEAIEPVSTTPLDRWVARGEGRHVVVKRLRAGLSDTQARQMQAFAPRWLGRPYDLTFGWSDDRIYCSELVWKLYRQVMGIELAPLSRLKDFRLDTPAVRAKLRERYGNTLPLNEPVVPPSALFDSPLLDTVHTQ